MADAAQSGRRQDSKRALLADVFEASDAAAAKLSLADLKSLLSP